MFQKMAAPMSSLLCRKGVRQRRAISQSDVPIPAAEAHPYTTALRCAGRTRPKVSQPHWLSRVGSFNLKEANSARSEPTSNQKTAEP